VRCASAVLLLCVDHFSNQVDGETGGVNWEHSEGARCEIVFTMHGAVRSISACLPVCVCVCDDVRGGVHVISR